MIGLIVLLTRFAFNRAVSGVDGRMASTTQN